LKVLYFFIFENLVFLIFSEHLAFLEVKLYMDIAWRVRPFDIPNEIKIFQIKSRITQTVI